MLEKRETLAGKLMQSVHVTVWPAYDWDTDAKLGDPQEANIYKWRFSSKQRKDWFTEWIIYAVADKKCCSFQLDFKTLLNVYGALKYNGECKKIQLCSLRTVEATPAVHSIKGITQPMKFNCKSRCYILFTELNAGFTIILSASETSWLFSLCSVPPLRQWALSAVWVEHWHLQWYNLMQKATQMTCFALNRQECRQVIWQIIKQNSNIELYINTVLLIQVPHWTDLLFMATGFNKALQSPWFALAELMLLGSMVKPFTHTRHKLHYIFWVLLGLKQKRVHRCEWTATAANGKYMRRPIILQMI